MTATIDTISYGFMELEIKIADGSSHKKVVDLFALRGEFSRLNDGWKAKGGVPFEEANAECRAVMAVYGLPDPGGLTGCYMVADWVIALGAGVLKKFEATCNTLSEGS